jgi:hypothetical protein
VGIRGVDLQVNAGDSLRRPHAREMDFTGKPMQGYVYVEPAGLETQEELQFWLQRCKQFVSTLPAKKAT